MVPLWFLPFAVVSGNTFILKPSEQVPLSMRRIFELLAECDLPPGVVNLVNGGAEVAEAICDHPGIRAVSFVGSTAIARHVYQRASHAGKRVQALGGAKNFIVVMPDADLDRAIPTITESFYGCAGERCLAGSVLLPVGPAHADVRDRLVEAARALQVGDGTDPAVQMGPVISARHRDRVNGYVETGLHEGAKLVLDGRARRLPGDGFFVGPSVFDAVAPTMAIGREEIFGPVAAVCGVRGSRRGVPHPRRASERQRRVGVHHRWPDRARVRASRDGVDGRRQHRRRRADGVFPVRRRARQLLRRSESARARRVRVLHGQEGHDLALVGRRFDWFRRFRRFNR